ncbi:MAG: hypothetical protein D6788_11160 [Planctomycetota bacterium]|nr:MAG: hypothetical protein D6788_11160 [Planctomycetota bacterium]
MKHDPEQIGEQLTAYLDGELDEPQRREMEKLIARRPEVRRRLEEMRRVSHLVSSLPRHDAPPSIAEDVQRHLERSALVDDWDGGRDEAPPVRLGWGRGLAVAAVVTLVAGVGWFLTREGQPGFTESLTFREKETVSPPPPAKRVPPPPSALQGLVASATLEQKLEAGLGPQVVKEHRFDNEPVRLEVHARSRSARDEIASRLVAYLAEASLTDAGTLETAASKSAPRRVEAFFYRGRSGVNFRAHNEQQILVRAPKKTLKTMLDQLADLASGGERIALQAGPARMRGAANVRAALSGLEGTVARGESETETLPEREDERLALRTDPFGELLRFIRMGSVPAEKETGENLSQAPKAKPGPTPAEPPEEAVANAPMTASTPSPGSVASADRSSGANRGTTLEGKETRDRSPRKARSARKRSRRAKKKKTTSEPSSLVERRLREIRRRRRAQPSPASPARAKGMPIKTPPDAQARGDASGDEYVTLVIAVRVDEPNVRQRGARPFSPQKKPKKSQARKFPSSS